MRRDDSSREGARGCSERGALAKASSIEKVLKVIEVISSSISAGEVGTAMPPKSVRCVHAQCCRHMKRSGVSHSDDRNPPTRPAGQVAGPPSMSACII